MNLKFLFKLQNHKTQIPSINKLFLLRLVELPFYWLCLFFFSIIHLTAKTTTLSNGQAGNTTKDHYYFRKELCILHCRKLWNLGDGFGLVWFILYFFVCFFSLHQQIFNGVFKVRESTRVMMLWLVQAAKVITLVFSSFFPHYLIAKS